MSEGGVVINEELRSVSGWMSYQVSNIGRVRRIDSGIFKNVPEDSNGRLRINLYDNGRSAKLLVHRLVAHEIQEIICLTNYVGSRSMRTI